ncbi:hypothetical protein ACFOHK_17275 [Falsigemmobacter intermedius]
MTASLMDCDDPTLAQRCRRGAVTTSESSTSVVNPPVAALPPVAGITSPAPVVSGQILGQAALDLIGPTGGGAGAGTAPPDTVRLGGPVSREQRRLIDRLLSQNEASVGGTAGLIRPAAPSHRSSF